MSTVCRGRDGTEMDTLPIPPPTYGSTVSETSGARFTADSPFLFTAGHGITMGPDRDLEANSLPATLHQVTEVRDTSVWQSSTARRSHPTRSSVKKHFKSAVWTLCYAGGALVLAGGVVTWIVIGTLCSRQEQVETSPGHFENERLCPWNHPKSYQDSHGGTDNSAIKRSEASETARYLVSHKGNPYVIVTLTPTESDD